MDIVKAMERTRSRSEILVDETAYKNEKHCHICRKQLGTGVLHTKKHFW